MNAEEYLKILTQAAKLKTAYRHCYTEGERRESVADHSWRIALMAMLLREEEEFSDTDIDKVIRMCLIHDLGEAFTGDIPTFVKKDSDRETEDDIFLHWVNSFSSRQREEWLSLLAEMNELQTPEARLYKALDRMEALISHNESAIDTWLPLEYDLQFTYGKKDISFSPFLTELRKVLDLWSKVKIETEKDSLVTLDDALDYSKHNNKC